MRASGPVGEVQRRLRSPRPAAGGNTPTPGAGRFPGVLAEETAEIGGILEAERERDLLDGSVAGFEPHGGLFDDALLDQGARRPLQFTAAERVQPVRRHAEETGVVGHAELLVISLLEQPPKASEDLGTAAFLFLGGVAG